MTRPGRTSVECCKGCAPDRLERAFGLKTCAWTECTCHKFKKVGEDRKVSEAKSGVYVRYPKR